MISARCNAMLRFGPRPLGLIRALVGAGCVRVALALPAGSGPVGASPAATAVQWISCTISLILLAMLHRDVQARLPGIGSLFRGCSYAALAGSLLPGAASLLFFGGLGGAPALAAALAGLALTLLGAMPLEWLVRDVRVDGPLPGESVDDGAAGGLEPDCGRQRLGREAGGQGSFSVAAALGWKPRKSRLGFRWFARTRSFPPGATRRTHGLLCNIGTPRAADRLLHARSRSSGSS